MSKKSNRPLERQLRILEVIIKHVNKNPKEETFRIRLEDFSAQHPLLQDRDGLEIAFEKINNEAEGATSLSFDFVKIGPQMQTATGNKNDSGYQAVKVHVEDINKLKDLYKDKEKETANGINEEKIKFIEIVEDKVGSRLTIYVNKNYDLKTIRPDSKTRRWEALKEIAEHGTASREGKDAQSIVDFFNTNTKNQLYTRTEYLLTNILQRNDNEIIPLISIKMVTQKALNQRKTKDT